MQFNQFPTNFPLTDNDTLLLYSDSAQIVTQVKLSVLKAFLGVAATPPPVTAPPLNHVKWYKADNIIQDVNGKVTAFIDQSASANNLTVLAGTPTLVANAINNKNAVKFNVATMRHVAQSYAAKTAFLVYRPNHGNFTDYDGYFAALSSFSDKVPASNEVFDLRGVPGSLKCYSERCTKVYVDNALQSTSAINNYQVGISVGEISRFHLVEMYFANSVSGTKNLLVGADPYQTGRYVKDLDIAEFVIYPFELNAEERTSILSYFKSRYAFSFL